MPPSTRTRARRSDGARADGEPSSRPIARAEPPLHVLDALELDLLVVLSLLEPGLPFARSSWQKEAADRGVRLGSGRRPSTTDLIPICERLVALELVDAPVGYASAYFVRADIAMRVLEHALKDGRLDRLRAPPLDDPDRRRNWRTPEDPATTLRIAILQGDAKAVRDLATRAFGGTAREVGEWLLGSLGTMPEPAWVVALPPEVQVAYLDALLTMAALILLPVRPDLEALAASLEDKALRLRLARLSAMRGEPPGVPDVADDPKRLPRWGAEGLAVLRAFFRGDYAEAAARADAACASMTSRRHKILSDLEGVVHIVASLACAGAEPQRIDALADTLVSAPHDEHLRLVVDPLFRMHRALIGDRTRVRPLVVGDSAADGVWTSALVRLLHDLWIEPTDDDPQKRLVDFRRSAAEAARTLADAWTARAEAGGYLPIAREMSAIAAAFAGETPRTDRLAGAFRAPQPWETALARLEALAEASATAEKDASTTTFVWQVAVHRWGAEVKPRIRTGPRAKKGTLASTERLLDEREAGNIDAHDRRAIDAYFGGRAGDPFGDFDEEVYDSRGPVGPGLSALCGLVGHPRVVDVHGDPITVERGVPRLHTRRIGDATRVELSPEGLLAERIAIEQPAPNRIVVYERPPKLETFVDVLKHTAGLEVPDSAADRLTRALARVCIAAGMEVEGDLAIAADTIAADGRIVVQLDWTGDTLGVRACVAPLGAHGPHVRPGSGAATIVGDAGEAAASGPGAAGPGGLGVPVLSRCRRDLKAEREALKLVLDACPTLAEFATGDLLWSVPSLVDALDVLTELDACVSGHPDTVVLAWRTDRRLDVRRRVDLSDMHFRIEGRTDWFGVDATLHVDQHTMLGFAAVMASRAGPRFVRLDRDRFVALSDRLRRQLDALADLGWLDDEELKVPPVALPRLDELLADVEGVRWSDDARAKLERLHEATAFTPRVPRSLAATLRDYQRDGYEWMSRLARAGLGACLADDMGLGKTVQAIALLCERATLGPALVVCPTSVVGNWLAELQRFAPGLRGAALGSASDRAALMSGLRTRDVLVCSYALLASEADALAEIELSTAVFDEAHALKNDHTKRAKAARRIQAPFRLGLTGTPIENRVSELWSLFSVLVPGLLGDRDRFERRFGLPIGRGDRERAAHLRALLRTFVLRRTKAQVLDELPPRTDVTIRVEPGPAERAFYEATRRLALERIEAVEKKKRRFRILAELAKVRQAAVDPRLVDPAGPPGAKVELLVRKLVDLREEGHRALVFSQFLGGMAAVRDGLAALGIEVMELDGATPATERVRRIEAFQAGEADVFLLSLRAGGIGINLTAADYVFHLDPWWNPAVEDQATDRAHRIGQTRPVTVYRLVTQGTIEEKILALHASKRQLAGDLLEGMEGGAPLDLDELMALLDR